LRNQNILSFALISIAVISMVTPLVSADSLIKDDFQQESFSKTVDYFDYVRTYALVNGVQIPEDFIKWHANLYTTYVNNNGLKLFYAGLENMTTDEMGYLRIPMQSFIIHYKTHSEQDAITASTFLMLLAFNETSNSLYSNSPDQNDVLYASFSLGFDLSELNAALPILNSKTETTPLTSSSDGLEWTWGMKYTNLTALWWRTWIDPNNPRFDNSWPLALTVYDELTFSYKLTIDPTVGTAILRENHVIGRMRDLVVGALPIIWTHYNSTGTYGMAGRKLGDETIYDYIQNNGLKMSIVDFQTSIVANHSTYSATTSGQDVSVSTDVSVSDTSIDTFSDDGEKVSTTDFGAKQAYKRFNYTADATENTFETCESAARTISAAGFAGNGGLFALHIGLMKLLPLVVIHLYPAMFARAMDTLSDMTKADYWYTIAYPEYSGYKVEHDPIFTVYIASQQAAPTTTTPFQPSPSLITSPVGSTKGAGIIIVGVILIIVISIFAVILLSKKKSKDLS
jgi:hypothetical protein